MPQNETLQINFSTSEQSVTEGRTIEGFPQSLAFAMDLG